MFVIVKKIKNSKGIIIPIILLDPNTNEILEFESFSDAERIKEIFQKNSDHGYEYEVKQI